MPLSDVILMFEICSKRIAVIVNFVTLLSVHRDKNLEENPREKLLKNVAVCKEINLCWLIQG